jgi:hypothetical protein
MLSIQTTLPAVHADHSHDLPNIFPGKCQQIDQEIQIHAERKYQITIYDRFDSNLKKIIPRAEAASLYKLMR